MLCIIYILVFEYQNNIINFIPFNTDTHNTCEVSPVKKKRSIMNSRYFYQINIQRNIFMQTSLINLVKQIYSFKI